MAVMSSLVAITAAMFKRAVAYKYQFLQFQLVDRGLLDVSNTEFWVLYSIDIVVITVVVVDEHWHSTVTCFSVMPCSAKILIQSVSKQTTYKI